MKVRKAEAEDMDVIRALNTECLEGPWLGEPNDLWWIAEQGKIPVAYAGLRLVNCDWAGYIPAVGVRKQYRGQGLMQKMLSEIEKYARHRGLLYLVTYTASDNIPSANNFIKAGYMLDWPDFSWGLGPGWIYWKKPLVA
jgi:ribosomal protein S18 acetylase RimI-like enzyme